MSDNCAESEYVPSWREYMKENSAWQSERTPNVYAAGFRAGMAYRPKVTYAPEDPTPEAIDVVSLVRRERVHPEAEAFQCRVTALALDAWGAALLKRREAAKSPGEPSALDTHGGCTAKEWYDRASRTWQTLLDEKAAHEATRDGGNQALADCFDRLKVAEAAHQATKAELERRHGNTPVPSAGIDAEMWAARAERDAAHEAFAHEKAAHQVTRKELVQAREALAAYSASRMGAYWRDKYRASQAELESLRKPLEGELAKDVETLRHCLDTRVYEDISEYRAISAALDRIEAALRTKGESK